MKKSNSKGHQKCAISGLLLPPSDLVPLELLRYAIITRIRKDHPNLPDHAFISRREANRYRLAYVEDLLRAERGELSTLEQQVAGSLAEGELITANIEKDYATSRTFSERASDDPCQLWR